MGLLHRRLLAAQTSLRQRRFFSPSSLVGAVPVWREVFVPSETVSLTVPAKRLPQRAEDVNNCCAQHILSVRHVC